MPQTTVQQALRVVRGLPAAEMLMLLDALCYAQPRAVVEQVNELARRRQLAVRQDVEARLPGGALSAVPGPR
jgi:hypothetical protein